MAMKFFQTIVASTMNTQDRKS